MSFGAQTDVAVPNVFMGIICKVGSFPCSLQGSIDLDRCEEVLSSLDSHNYDFLFSLHTVDSRRPSESRIYYLAANSQEDMDEWVSVLCRTLGLSATDGGKMMGATSSLACTLVVSRSVYCVSCFVF